MKKTFSQRFFIKVLKKTLRNVFFKYTIIQKTVRNVFCIITQASSSLLSRAYYWLELFEPSLLPARALFKPAREPLSQFNHGSVRLGLKSSSQLVSQLGSCGALTVSKELLPPMSSNINLIAVSGTRTS